MIAEFAFADVYDAKHRAIQVDAIPKPVAYLQKGFRSPLLCVECEGFINEEFEKPFKRMWVDASPFPPIIIKPHYTVSVKDPDRFRLFMLSVLWRASVCPDAPFANFTLRPHVEEEIRQKLLRRNAGPISEYPIVAVLPVMRDLREVAALIVPPFVQNEGKGVDSVNFTFAKCLWKILMTKSDTAVLGKSRLRADGRMRVENVDVLEIEQFKTIYFRHFEEAERQGWTEPWNR